MRLRRTKKTLRGVSMLVAASMLFGALPVAAGAAGAAGAGQGAGAQAFADMPSDWSTSALQHAVANGLLRGADGKINPNAQLTRAEMASIVVRMFGASVKGDLAAFEDVAPGAWYAPDMAIAYHMGAVGGSNGQMRPKDAVTREEAFTILARVFKLQPAEASNVAFADAGELSAWAKGSVHAIANAGYVHGADGKLNPKGRMTRAEFAQTLDNMIKQYVRSAGVVTEVAQGNVLINAPGVMLDNVTVNGDLILGDGVGNGEITLHNVNVTGRMVVRGGGENSVIIKGNSSVSRVIVSRIDGVVSVKVQDDARVEVVYVDDGSDDVNVQGTVGSIAVAAPEVTVTARKATMKEVSISGEHSRVIVDEDSSADTVTVNAEAAGARVDVAGTVGAVATAAEGTEVAGAGKVAKVEVKSGGANAKITTPGTSISVAAGVTGVTGGGGAAIAGGTSAVNNGAGSDLVRPSSPVTSTPDRTPPVIALKGEATVHVAYGSDYADAGVTVTDNQDSALSATVTYTKNGEPVSSIDTTSAGTYVVHYNVRDTAGNPAAEATREVVVDQAAPPVISNVGIASNNESPGVAAIGDTITLTFTADVPVTKLDNFKINGSNPDTFTNVGSVYTATHLVDDGDPVTGEPATFQINVKNAQGIYSLTVEATTDGSAVTIVRKPAVASVSPAAGPAAGGTSVTLAGTGFTDATDVTFGDAPAASFTVDSDTQITAVAPAGTAGAADVTVTKVGGTGTKTGGFTYVAAPAIAGISPAVGPEAGGTSVTITGIGFTGATAVAFGGEPVTGYTIVSDTQITATVPAGTAGAANVAVTTIGGTGTKVGGFTYVAAPATVSVSPSAGPAAGGTSVTITGTGFTGATAVNFGGEAAASFEVDSNTQITAVAPAGTAGAVDVTVTTIGGTATAAAGYTYVAAPTIASVSPSAGPTVGGTIVTIAGTGFTGATAVTFGGTAATGFTLVSNTQIVATAPAGSAGSANVAVTTIGGTGTKAAGYTYVAAPTIASVSPSAGPTAGGTSVTITGTGFTGATAVTFGGMPAISFAVFSDTMIVATSPAAAPGSANLAVTTSGGTGTKAGGFTYVGVPSITSISPAAGPDSGGNIVTISGSGFTGATAVTFDGMPGSITGIVTDTQLTVIVPSSWFTGSADVTVTSFGGSTTATAGYTFVATPVVNAISPAYGSVAGGTLVTIAGNGLTDAASVTFGGEAAVSFTVISDTQISATVPAGMEGAVDVVVTTAGGMGTVIGGFTYVAAPTVTSISKPIGPDSGGNTVTITGSGLYWTTGVTFGGVSVYDYTPISPTQLNVIVPAGMAGAPVDVTVTTYGGSGTLTGSYTYAAMPNIIQISPTAGPVTGGTAVVITGSGFAHTTEVWFGGEKVPFTINSDTQITLVTPASAPGFVDVIVMGEGGSSTVSDAFTYIAEP
ncbi:IPT/TIG domain-containing protein [Paenibacillus sp. MWE-103]|uniref:IPT/TIG domain-containing protein n=1 Tax=Paenibacillus artemisiicola TaxID=1172618 RepID=A0ABS3WEY5_9BACL|nr:IPT/TIG domain-containing protein [Paenibacillus artemisiicola]MBO7746880.1 IPT/TIG domain-containing protein [Paenibacillus artemisiicola]